MPNALPYNQYYLVPHNSTGLFTGRDDVLRKLHDCFFPSRNDIRLATQKRFIVFGLGGSGKTQTCTVFAEAHRERLVVQYRHGCEGVAVRLTLDQVLGYLLDRCEYSDDNTTRISRYSSTVWAWYRTRYRKAMAFEYSTALAIDY